MTSVKTLKSIRERKKEAAPDFERVEKATRLDQYYIPTRYPNSLPGGVPSRFYTDPEEAPSHLAVSSGLRCSKVRAWVWMTNRSASAVVMSRLCTTSPAVRP